MAHRFPQASESSRGISLPPSSPERRQRAPEGSASARLFTARRSGAAGCRLVAFQEEFWIPVEHSSAPASDLWLEEFSSALQHLARSSVFSQLRPKTTLTREASSQPLSAKVVNLSEGARTQTHPPASQKCDLSFLFFFALFNLEDRGGEKKKTKTLCGFGNITQLFCSSTVLHFRTCDSAPLLLEEKKPASRAASSPPQGHRRSGEEVLSSPSTPASIASPSRLETPDQTRNIGSRNRNLGRLKEEKDPRGSTFPNQEAAASGPGRVRVGG